MKNTFFESCARCGGRVERLWIPGTEERFRPALLRTLVLPVGGAELVFLLGASMLTATLAPSASGGSTAGFLLMLVLDAALATAVVHSVADPGATIERGQLVREAARTLVLFGLAAAPLWLFPAGGAPVAAAIVAPGVVGALAVIASGAELWSSDRWSRLLRAARADLVFAAGIASAVTLVALWLFGVGEHLGREGVRFHEVLVRLCACYLLLVLPRLSGLLLRVHGEAVDYPFTSVRQIPALPGARGRAPSDAARSPAHEK